MAIILSIETATNVCSVAVHNKGVLLSLSELHLENSHSQKLMDLIAHVLKQTGLASVDFDAIAVSGGPGSYTGLRIGVSVAKGLAFAGKIPLINVCTLTALAAQVFSFAENNSLIIPMIDARRMEIYGMVLRGNGEVIEDAQPFLLEEEPFHNLIEAGGKIYILGDGAEKAKGTISYEGAVFLPFENSAKTIGTLAWDKYQKNDFCDIAYFEPNYLKEFRVLQSTKNPLLT